MSSSPSLEDLLAAARADAPSREVQDAVWGRVAATAATTAAGAAVGKAAIKAAAVKTSLVTGGAKLLVVGAVIGAAGAATLFQVWSSPSSSSTPSSLTAPAHGAVPFTAPAPSGVSLTAPAPSADALGAALEIGDVPPELPRTAPGPRVRDDARVSDRAPVVLDLDSRASSLAQEAALVTEARASLLRGDPDRALMLARSSSTLPTRALEPEELALEARALRALGRNDEAENVENALRRRFPENSLAHPKTK